MKTFHYLLRPLLLLIISMPVMALDIVGTVRLDNAEPLPFVRIRVSHDSMVPYSRTVFTDKKGAFSLQIPDLQIDKLEIQAFRIGWAEKNREMVRASREARVTIVMEPVANMADQVPASAWLQGDTESLAYQMSNLHCANCHQLGAQRVKDFSAKLADLPVDERAEAWLKRSVEDLSYDGTRGAWREKEGIPEHQRVKAWESIVQYMRYVTMHLGEEKKLRWGLKEGSDYFNALLTPETSLFLPRDMEIIVPYLAHNFPVNFESYTDYSDLEKLGPYGTTSKTTIDEYVLPTFGWTREIAIAPGSPYVWFVETDKDRLGALNPADGSVEWFDIPGEGQQGPHTMNADARGNLWVGLEDSFYIARFNTKTKAWRIYAPPEGKSFGVTHDFAYNSDRHVEPDSTGRIWITDMGMNELWGIDVESGEVETFKMPLPVGETHFHSLLYGAAFDSVRDRVWWAQLYGNVGSFDPVNNRVERIVPVERGEGARRLAIQEDGVLWIPMFGSSELVKFDSINGIELARYPIPDRGGSPYGVTLDKKRNAIWAATSNSDRIYRFDIASEKWTHYPMPRKEAYIRMIEIHPDTGDVWTTYASLPTGKRDPGKYGIESANNIIVRLVPGD